MQVSVLDEIARTTRDSKQALNQLLRQADRQHHKGGEDGKEFVRFVAANALRGPQQSVEDSYAQRYGGRQRAVSNPAMTTVPGWAMELVHPATVMSFLARPPAPTLLSQLSALGLTLELSSMTKIPIPAHGTPRGSWVQESMPIRVIQTPLTSLTVMPRKVGAISEFSIELRKRSVPDADAVIANLLRRDLGDLLDLSLTDSEPATTIRPAGLLNGVAPTTPGVDALATLRALVGAVVAAGGLMPVVMSNPTTALGFASLPALAVPLLTSPMIPAGRVIVVDGSAFVSILGPPEAEISDQATVHEESENPLPLVVGGTFATPTRSAWQTASLSCRTLIDAGWAVPPGLVAYSDVTW